MKKFIFICILILLFNISIEAQESTDFLSFQTIDTSEQVSAVYDLLCSCGFIKETLQWNGYQYTGSIGVWKVVKQLKPLPKESNNHSNGKNGGCKS